MSGHLGDSFDGVLAAARAGEGWAFARLFESLARPVAAYLRSGGAEDPDGATNEVFLRAFRGLDRFDGGEERFRSWVLTIAHHLLVDEHRQRARRARAVPLDDHEEPTVDDDTEAVLGDARVRRLLAPDQRDVVLLRIVADLSIEDAAAVLGKKPNAVKQLQHRAMRALRKMLDEEA
jgi:RNA polymerase sigma factor (sigma-70 family)